MSLLFNLLSFIREICTEHEETETKVLDSYEKLKEESKNIEKQRDQVCTVA